MSSSINNAPNNEENLLTVLLRKFLPYWPVFIGLAILSMALAWVYLRYATPVYEIAATLIIKDEKKGVDDARMTESINAFASKKIVENEIEVIQSRALMKKVALGLHLYAPVYEDTKFKEVAAYTSSPVIVTHYNPDAILATEDEPQKIYFTYNPDLEEVTVDGKSYPLNKSIRMPYGVIKFIPNDHQSSQAKEQLYFQLLPLKAVTASLLNNLQVNAANKLSTVVNLQLKDAVPERGEAILNLLVHNYNQASVVERNILAENTLAFIEDRMQKVEKELDKLESRVQKYKTSKGIVDLSEQGRTFLQNMSANDSKVEDINLQLAVLAKIENYIIAKDKSAGIVPSTLGINDPVLTQLLQKLYDNEIQYQRLRKTTAVNNPILLSIADEIEKIRPSILENIQNQRDNLLASRKNLTNTKGSYTTALQTIPKQERELLEISRQQAIKNNVYTLLLQKREETALSFAPSATDSKVVDVAESSFAPVSPKRNIIYLGALAFAFIVSIVLVTAKDFFSSKILYRTDIEAYTHAPIVAELMKVKHDDSQLFTKPDNPVVIEQFRQLRTSLGLYSRTFKKRKILVTSSIPGEGKSFVSTNLAYSLAASGKRVVLVDMDMRKPKTSTQFGMLNQKGVTDYINAQYAAEELLQRTPFDNLWILPAGSKPGDHTEALLNGRVEDLFHHLEADFDFIVIDTPPVDLVSDGYLISEFCDITLLIIRHDHTPKNIIKYLNYSNKHKSLHNLAIVFNGVKPRGFANREYGYGYGYRYDHVYHNKAYS
ncbi:GumC family protein [Pontibacter oryzae]|uniref:non-specific protein-tyrosine kinase n=1 Tax=Pontibacter oryzae TaxID=2304593 RepID=A0A399SH26_9BACT|nr:tyrosine-protein kinase [Pontibacter oryzae]RIJ42304.1 polysaccharide biosynthesis tyrosine autokinase [Pontibacter oryzae]